MCAPSQTFSHYPAWPAPIELPLVECPEHPCVYLPGRSAKIRAFMTDRMPPDMYDQFMDAGFRRSGRIIYQPVCAGCRACVPIRIMVSDFRPGKAQRRCWRRNRDLRVDISSAAQATSEEFDLYSRYVNQWHENRTEDETPESFERFLRESPVNSIKFTYRDSSNCLLAVGICDNSPQALSSVYFYFDPSRSRRGLGTYGALVEIDYAARNGIPAYYLGYWVEGCPSMQYKTSFKPSQMLGTDGLWRATDAAQTL